MTLPKKDFQPIDVDVRRTQSDEDILKASYIKDRFLRMKEARSVVDADWQIFWKMLEAIYRPYED